jgi:hypothetical protein
MSTPPSGMKGLKLRRWIHTQRFKAAHAITKRAHNVLARRKPKGVQGIMIFCTTAYYVVLLIMIHMQLMAAMRYFDRMESEMSRDQFDDLVRKFKLAFAPPTPNLR